MGMQLIETYTASTTVTGINLTSIPQTGTDLLILVSARTAQTGVDYSSLSFLLNNNSSNRTSIQLEGDGSNVFNYSRTFFPIAVSSNSNTSGAFGNASICISNYTSSSAKPISFESVTENNAAAARQVISSGLWNDTSAVTSVDFSFATGILANSTISLYIITPD